jgi:hypothetical protein
VDDPLEHEAEAVAETLDVSSETIASDTESEIVQRSAAHGDDHSAELTAPASVHEVLGSSGQGLDADLRTEMEEHLGVSLGHVRVHTDARAAASADDVEAHAYTVGEHVVFGHGEFSPHDAAGRHLLAHELTHVRQQTAAPPQPTARRDILRRDDKKKGKKTPAKAKGPDLSKWTFGEAVLKGKAVEDLLKSQSIFKSDDNTHLAVTTDGKLGYDPTYTTPADPFRWQKLKDVVDSKEKIVIDRVGFTDTFKVKHFDGTKTTILEHTLASAAAEGITLPTESLQRKAISGATRLAASPDADTSYIHYQNLGGTASAGPLAHELFGHMWLAIKGVPFQHPDPKDKAAMKSQGTLEAAHGITTPFGAVYSGPVKDFIGDFISSSSIDPGASPTLGVGPDPLARELKFLKDNFDKKATGKLNGDTRVPGDIVQAWEGISRNWEMLTKEPAPAAGTKPTFSQEAIEKAVTAFYGSLSADKQYVFVRYIEEDGKNALHNIGLDLKLLKTLSKPQGMR